MTWSSGYTAFVVDAYAAFQTHLGHPFGGAIHHRDAGSQYTAIYFGKTPMLAGLRPSIGIVGDALDNALCETTTGPHRTECSHGSPFRSGPIRTLADLEDIASAWVEHTCHTQQGVRIPGRLQPA